MLRGSSPRALQRSTWNASVSHVRLVLQHPLQRRVGDQPAVPVMLALDLHRRKAGRQGAAGHHVLRPDHVHLCIEIAEISGADIDRADAEAHFAGIDAVEIDEPLQRRLERRRVVMARRLRRAGRRQPGRHDTRHEETRHAPRHDHRRAHLIDQAACGVALRQRPRRFRQSPPAMLRHRLPEGAQPLDASLRRIAGDERRIDGTDRDAGNPVGMEMGLGQGLVDPRLIGAERAAPLEQQCDLFEGRTLQRVVALPLAMWPLRRRGGRIHQRSAVPGRVWPI